MKMWQGRFKKEEDERVNDFNSSISFDSRMYKQDITGSMRTPKCSAILASSIKAKANASSAV